MGTLVLTLVCAYLIGGIPNSYLIVRVFKGIDLRTIGSGNLGATNASRAFPRPMSSAVFLGCFCLDAAKGFLPACFLAPLLEGGPTGGFDPATRVLVIGLAAILGHVYTPYMRFKGGKGVATTLGVFLAAAPAAMLFALGVGGALILATGYASVGSIAMGLVLPAAVIVRQPQAHLLCALTVAVGAFIIFKHRSNIGRLIRGNESRLFGKASEERAAARSGDQER